MYTQDVGARILTIELNVVVQWLKYVSHSASQDRNHTTLNWGVRGCHPHIEVKR